MDGNTILNLAELDGLYMPENPPQIAEGYFGQARKGMRGPDSARKGKRGPDSAERRDPKPWHSRPHVGPFGQVDTAKASTAVVVIGTLALVALNFLAMAFAAKVGARWAGCGR